MRSVVDVPLIALIVALSLPVAPPAGAAEEWVGQVVCSQCWFEADRRHVPYGTPGDLDCAARCAARGVPPALAVRDGDGFELLLLEGAGADSAASWRELTGKFVRVTGEARETADRGTLRVASVELLEHSPWASGEPRDEPETAPAALEWTDLGGQSRSLASLRGRIVVLNFWATWCVPCRDEIPDLVRIQNRYGMWGVQVLGAAADADEQRPHVIEFGRKLRVNFPLVLGATTEQMESLGLGVVLPATAVLDREGRVVRTVRGVFDRRDLERTLDALLAGDLEAARAGTAHRHDAHHTHVARGDGPRDDTRASLVPS